MARKNFGPNSFITPEPVLMIAAYDEEGTPDIMNAAWGGISESTEISICIDDAHKTAENILKRGAFTVSMADKENVIAADYVGVVSGNKEPDKFHKAGFSSVKSEFVNAPIIEQLPMCLECELVSYDSESCYMIGRIINISVDDCIINENGKIDVQKLQPITYDPCNHDYIALGEKVGNAFSDGKKLK